jgi:hypothetical protein
MRKSFLLLGFFLISCESVNRDVEAMKVYDYSSELGSYQEFGVEDFIDNRAEENSYYYLTGLYTTCCQGVGCFSTKTLEDSGAYTNRADYFSKISQLDAVYGKFAPQVGATGGAKASCPAEVAGVVKTKNGTITDIFKYSYEFNWEGTFLANESLKEFSISSGSKASWMKRFNEKDKIRYFKNKKEPNKLFAVLVTLQTQDGNLASYLAFYTKLAELAISQP